MAGRVYEESAERVEEEACLRVKTATEELKTERNLDKKTVSGHV